MSRNTTRVLPTVASPKDVDCSDADGAIVQIIGLSGGDTITVSASLNGTDYAPWYLMDSTYAPVTSFSDEGMYLTDAGCWLRFTKAGSASTPTVIVRATA